MKKLMVLGVMALMMVPVLSLAEHDDPEIDCAVAMVDCQEYPDHPCCGHWAGVRELMERLSTPLPLVLLSEDPGYVEELEDEVFVSDELFTLDFQSVPPWSDITDHGSAEPTWMMILREYEQASCRLCCRPCGILTCCKLCCIA